VVPLFSALLHGVEANRNLLRALYVSSSQQRHAPDFLMALLALTLHMRNAGVAFVDLMPHLSGFVKGRLLTRGGGAHSAIHKDACVYRAAMTWFFADDGDDENDDAVSDGGGGGGDGGGGGGGGGDGGGSGGDGGGSGGDGGGSSSGDTDDSTHLDKQSEGRSKKGTSKVSKMSLKKSVEKSACGCDVGDGLLVTSSHALPDTASSAFASPTKTTTTVTTTTTLTTPSSATIVSDADDSGSKSVDTSKADDDTVATTNAAKGDKDKDKNKDKDKRDEFAVAVRGVVERGGTTDAYNGGGGGGGGGCVAAVETSALSPALDSRCVAAALKHVRVRRHYARRIELSTALPPTLLSLPPSQHRRRLARGSVRMHALSSFQFAADFDASFTLSPLNQYLIAMKVRQLIDITLAHAAAAPPSPPPLSLPSSSSSSSSRADALLLRRLCAQLSDLCVVYAPRSKVRQALVATVRPVFQAHRDARVRVPFDGALAMTAAMEAADAAAAKAVVANKKAATVNIKAAAKSAASTSSRKVKAGGVADSKPVSDNSDAAVELPPPPPPFRLPLSIVRATSSAPSSSASLRSASPPPLATSTDATLATVPSTSFLRQRLRRFISASGIV
jgi:hypothetical protein